MKTVIRSLVLITTLLMSFCSFSQEYIPLVQENKTWSTFHSYCKSPGNYLFSDYMKIEGEAVINDTTYKQIWVCKDTVNEEWETGQLIREDSDKKVWMRNSTGTGDWLLYDFGMEPGDSITPNEFSPVYHLVSIDSILLLDGNYRRQYHLTESFGFCSEEIWIEGIGCLRGLTMGFMCGILGDDPKLICMLENGDVLYHNDDYEECHYITGTSEIEDLSGISVYPNPVYDGILYVDVPEGVKNLRINIFDQTGRNVLQYNLTPGKNSISTRHLSTGLYLIKSDKAVFHLVIKN